MKRLIPLVALLAAAGAGLAGARRHRRLSVVAPELRNPSLYMPMSLRNDAILRLIRRLPMPAGPIAEGVDVSTELIASGTEDPDVRVLVYQRADRTDPSGALVWIHGGGLVMGVAEQGQELCSRLAAELGIVVVNVDYRLAPEHPFPAALDDCYTALAWTHDHADRLGIDAARIAVGGDSAGGGLAACLAQMALDRRGPAVCFQVLQYPMLDDRTALRTTDPAFLWTNTSNRYAWSAYLGHPVTETEPRSYASAARRDDVTGLPPAWIGVGDIDLFHEECVDYAKRLTDAGVACELHVVPGMFHAAERLTPDAPSMRDFLTRMTAALRSAVMPAVLID